MPGLFMYIYSATMCYTHTKEYKIKYKNTNTNYVGKIIFMNLKQNVSVHTSGERAYPIPSFNQI